jgi:hypothetical protein
VVGGRRKEERGKRKVSSQQSDGLVLFLLYLEKIFVFNSQGK